MPNTTTSPNMMLTIPVVGVDPGPDYASNINLCLTTIDGHDHATGSGVQITPAGLSISSDLSFIANNATNLRSARFTSQTSTLALPSDVECVYVAGVDLYYNDGSGNTIRLTQSGSVAGASGSITGLTSPASATYVSASASFIWQSGVNIAANLDARNVILRNSTASSKGLTLSPPTGMASDYTVTLPSLPGSQSFVTLDASGAFAAPITYSLGITASNIANGTITYAKLAAGAIQTNSTSFTASSSWVVPGAVKNATFVVCGGGAGGGGGGAFTGGSNGAGGGGGSGSVAYERTITTIPGETLTITVGAAGAGGAGGPGSGSAGSDGADGGTSLVLRSGTTLFKVAGGFHGNGGSSGAAGGGGGTGGFFGVVLSSTGGTGGAADTAAGSAGLDSFYATGGSGGSGGTGGGGGGGGAGLGAGGAGANASTGAGSVPAATSFGAGGGGGSGGDHAFSGAGGAGGAGRAGVVIIYWTGDAS